MSRWFFAWLARTIAAGLLVLSGPVLALEARTLAPGVWMVPGALAEPDERNRGRVVNIGILAGDDGAIVIDSGANAEQGEEILAVAERLAGKPVRLLINTHPHPQNVLGNSAFAAKGVPILASSETRRLMAERCQRCIETLKRAVGNEAMTDTRIVLPNLFVDSSEVRIVAGRRLQILLTGHGHTEGDLAVLDTESGVLFTGDLVYREQIPHMSESRVGGWIDAVDRLRGVAVGIVVPGRGAPGRIDIIDRFAGYLTGMRDKVLSAIEDGRSLAETLLTDIGPHYAAWEGYGSRHSRNIQHVYLEMESAGWARKENK